MPPRLNVLSFARAIPIRSKPHSQWLAQPTVRVVASNVRPYSDLKDKPSTQEIKNKSEDNPIPHVSEEAAKMAEITGSEGPDLNQGTPVEDVVKGDQSMEDKLPKVMKDALRKSSSPTGPKGSRSYSTMATPAGGDAGMDMGLVNFSAVSKAPEQTGLKFQMPTLPLPKDGHLKHRYDDVVDQVTNLLMRHGQKSIAQRDMALILQHLRTSSVPTINPNRPLLPGAPPPSHLPLNPVLYLTLAIDSVAPLMRIRAIKGAAGGGVALQIPSPLGQRQRRRIAIQWMLGVASKKGNTGSGKGMFAQKVANEIIAIVEGRSPVWERRNALHKQGITARANIVLPRKR